MADPATAPDHSQDENDLSRARPVPRISIEAFADDERFLEVLREAGNDRRLVRCNLAGALGGIAAAYANYVENPTPELIVLDTALPREQLLAQLDALAEHCDAGTKVIVCGRDNDVVLYKELLRRGVSEYIVFPVTPFQILESISNLYNQPDASPIGHVVAFIGAKGGVGSSTISHNAAWCLAEELRTNVVVADFDLAFGTTGLDFNQDPIQGIGEAIAAPDRLDEVLLDRLLTKCTPNLSIFAAPAVLDREYDLDPEACHHILGVLSRTVPFVVLDLPHLWTAWSKRLLLQADEIVITAEPDLANLRNAKNILDLLKSARKMDNPPKLVLNKLGVAKRPEIPIKDFCASLDLKPTLVIDFDPESFGQASNNGQMIEEASKKAKSAAQFRELSRLIAHRKRPEPAAKPSPVAQLLEKLKLKL